jgi:hypothetical protein
MAQVIMASSDGKSRKRKSLVRNERHRLVALKLVDAHALRKDEPLQLALWFQTSDQKNLHLLEVVKNFPGPPEDELFSVESTLPPELAISGKLQLVLANAEQLRAAIDRNDPALQVIQMSDAEVLYPASVKPSSMVGQLLLKLRERRP